MTSAGQMRQVLPYRIERLSHETKRNGTASLLAALEVRSGNVLGPSIRRHDSDSFIRSLRRLLKEYPDQDLYVITGHSPVIPEGLE